MLDSKLNPHLIEVNISPSLAGSSPLDKRIKGTLIADMLHVVGIYPHDPKLIKQFDEVSLPSTVRINKKTKSSTKVSVRPSSAGYSKPLASQNQNQNGSGTGTDTSIGNPFLFGSMSKMMSSQDDWRRNPQPSNISFQGIGNNDAVWMMLLMVEDEIDRCKSTQFIQAHPTPTTAEHYNRLLTSHATRNSIKVSEFISNERLEQVKEDTKVGGATLTKLLGTSAWYAPGAAVSGLVQAIACDQKKIFPCSILLDGEYGLSDLCIGVPVVLGANGVEKIVEIELSDSEKAHLHTSAEGVKKTNSLLDV